MTTGNHWHISLPEPLAAIFRTFLLEERFLIWSHAFTFAAENRVFLATEKIAALIETKFDALGVPGNKAQEQRDLTYIEKDDGDSSEDTESLDSQDTRLSSNEKGKAVGERCDRD